MPITNSVPCEENGGVPVNVQDQATSVISNYAGIQVADSTVAVQTVIDAYTVQVADGTDFVVGHLLNLYDLVNSYFHEGEILSKVGDTLTIDTPLNHTYPVGSVARSKDVNLNKDGSVTPQIFSLKTTDPGFPIVADITRINIIMQTETAVDLSKFGDLPALSRGVFFRRVDGRIQNIFNIKSNADMMNLSGVDWVPFSSSNPQQGQDGLACRITFAGQNKMGVVVRLATDEDFQVIVQDDLTGLIDFKVLFQGHVAQD